MSKLKYVLTIALLISAFIMSMACGFTVAWHYVAPEQWMWLDPELVHRGKWFYVVGISIIYFHWANYTGKGKD